LDPDIRLASENDWESFSAFPRMALFVPEVGTLRSLQGRAGLQRFGFGEESVDDLAGRGQIGATVHSCGQVMAEEQPLVAPSEEQPEARQLLLRQEPLFQLITKVV